VHRREHNFSTRDVLSNLAFVFAGGGGRWEITLPEADRGADIVAHAGRDAIAFEVKSIAGALPDEAVVQFATAASRLRRSLPDYPEAKAVLVVLFDEFSPRQVESEDADFQIRDYAQLTRRLTTKSGYDAVIFGSRYPEQLFAYSSVSGNLRAKGPTEINHNVGLDLFVDLLSSHRSSSRTKSELPRTDAPSARKFSSTRPHTIQKFLLVTDEWNAGKGGISSFNRELAVALKKAGKDVCVYLPQVTSDEIIEAGELGIDLAVPSVSIPGLTGASALLAHQIRHLSRERYRPDVVIGHGRVLGPHAYYVQGIYNSPTPLRVHIVHTNPELLELAKEGDTLEPRTRVAQERRNLEIELARSSDLVAGVGPSLYSWIDDDLRAIDAPTPTIQIDPGLRDWGTPRNPEKLPSQREFLLIGRVEDFESKGVELAIRAVGTAARSYSGPEEVQLVLRGVPDSHAALRARVDAISATYGLKVVFRSYSADINDVRTDMKKAVAVLMPSPHEGFGLSAYEAIAMGTPVIISSESGLARFLATLVSNGSVTAEVSARKAGVVNSLELWADAIAQVLRQPASKLRNAAVLRAEIERLNLWERSVALLQGELEKAAITRLARN
jgi:D-inositol-3-phosphate glycosyltransferase